MCNSPVLYFLIPIKYFFISSGVFPLVSGQRSTTKTIPSAQIAPNRKYNPYAWISFSTSWLNALTINAHPQLNNVAKEDMGPWASFGNNSAFIAQGIGP